MSVYEIWAFIITAVGAVAGILGLVLQSRSSSLQNRANRQIHADKKQQKELHSTPLCSVKEERVSKNLGKLLVANVGCVDAYNVYCELLEDEEAPLDSGLFRFSEKEPYKQLRPEQFYEVTVILPWGHPTEFPIRLHWSDVDGEEKSDDFVLHFSASS